MIREDILDRRGTLEKLGTPRRKPLTFREPAGESWWKESLGLVSGLRRDIGWPASVRKGPHPWYLPAPGKLGQMVTLDSRATNRDCKSLKLGNKVDSALYRPEECT